MLCGGSYIYVGGIDIFMFTIYSSRNGLQNNTMVIISCDVLESIQKSVC